PSMPICCALLAWTFPVTVAPSRRQKFPLATVTLWYVPSRMSPLWQTTFGGSAAAPADADADATTPTAATSARPVRNFRMFSPLFVGRSFRAQEGERLPRVRNACGATVARAYKIAL